MMKRDECLKVLAHYHTDQIVVAAYQAAQEWLVIKPHVLNYTAIGAMGQASSHALGLALGRPNMGVLVLDGDGSLLMNLGSLVTIASEAPKNFIHCCPNSGSRCNSHTNSLAHSFCDAPSVHRYGHPIVCPHRCTYSYI